MKILDRIWQFFASVRLTNALLLALVVVVSHVVLISGVRSSGQITPAIASVAAFPVVVMTYYGMNYYLSGLHSYGAGSSPGIPWQVFAYLGAEALFLAWAMWKLPGAGRPRPAVALDRSTGSPPTTEVAS